MDGLVEVSEPINGRVEARVLDLEYETCLPEDLLRALPYAAEVAFQAELDFCDWRADHPDAPFLGYMCQLTAFAACTNYLTNSYVAIGRRFPHLLGKSGRNKSASQGLPEQRMRDFWQMRQPHDHSLNSPVAWLPLGKRAGHLRSNGPNAGGGMRRFEAAS
jgi:hypothetical protein